jgi:hypothetical protein
MIKSFRVSTAVMAAGGGQLERLSGVAIAEQWFVKAYGQSHFSFRPSLMIPGCVYC